MLNDTEVKRIIEAITDYKELIHQSSSVRDQLDSLQRRWNVLRQERDKFARGSMPFTPRCPRCGPTIREWSKT